MTTIVQTRLLPDQGQETVTLMDDYGTECQVYISIYDAANRSAYISTATSQLNDRQTTLENYAVAHNLDLTALRAAGAAKKAAYLGGTQ